jgi:hypothetical protein
MPGKSAAGATTTNRTRVVAGLFAATAIAGLAFFGVLAWRSVTVLRMDPTGALNNFEDARARVPSTPPLLHLDAGGAFVRQPSEGPTGQPATQLHALAYHVEGQRLVRADVPVWFFRVKGPAVRYALRDTGLDLDALKLTATDLEQAGSRIILDEQRANGDRLLVWTE